jgi:DNA-binding transcriptional LysR family regulator
LLLGEARDLVNRAEAVKLAMREFTGLARGRLAIKASQTIASHFLPSRLVDFHQAHPGVALVVSIGNSTEVVEAIIRGDIELGFVEGPTAARAAERWSFAERCQSKLTSSLATSLATPLATELRKRLALQH